MSKKYLSVFNDGTQDIYIKDAEAWERIQNGSKYIGKFISAVVGGETVTTLKDGDVVTSITTTKGTYVTGTPTGSQMQLNAGDYTQIVETGKASVEFMWNGSAMDEFGSTSLLKSLAFKDSASGSYTPAGTNAASAVSFSGQTDGDFVTGFETSPVLPSFSEGAFTPAEIQNGFVSAGSAASFTEGAFDAGTLPSKAADAFTAGSLPTMTYDEANEKLKFAPGTLPTFSEGAFSAGTLPSKAADSFTANVPTVVDVTKFSGGSKASDTFSAGTAPTLATDKAITAVGTGTAAAQEFSGTQATIVVS